MQKSICLQKKLLNLKYKHMLLENHILVETKFIAKKTGQMQLSKNAAKEVEQENYRSSFTLLEVPKESPLEKYVGKRIMMSNWANPSKVLHVSGEVGDAEIIKHSIYEPQHFLSAEENEGDFDKYE